MDYTTYFLMKPEDVAGYVRYKLPDYFSPDASLSCQEIGDGNINYVFRVADHASGKTIIVKQAAVETRISKDLKLSTDRGRIEADILTLQNRLCPNFVPEVYFYDSVMCAMAMVDMIGHRMMRTALMEHEIYPLFADQITTYMVQTLLPTSDLVMNHEDKKRLVKDFINPDLCDLTEHLVYSEPYLDYNHRNNIYPPNAQFIQEEIYNDETLKLEAAKFKFQFMNDAQALIHGDLHTGSIFINKEHTFIFDPEFAFFGPMSYDTGNIVANMFFAWCHGDAQIEDPEQREAFCTWTLECIEQIVDLFKEKFVAEAKKTITDPMAKTPGFLDWYVGKLISETAGIAGIETIRRTVGMANVKDITSIGDEKKRTRAERILLVLAKDYIKNRESFKTGADFRNAIDRAIERFPKEG